MIIEHQNVAQQLFGEIDGKPITLYTIKNMNGFQVSCIDYGCIITEVLAPDQTGNFENVVLGFDSLDEYKRDVQLPDALPGASGTAEPKLKADVISLTAIQTAIICTEAHLAGIQSDGSLRLLWTRTVPELNLHIPVRTEKRDIRAAWR